MISESTVNNLIQQGENSAVEFKAAGVRAESIAREIVAFANSGGGTVLVGVADNGTVSGIDRDFDIEEWIANIARHNVRPSIQLLVSRVSMQGKTVAAIKVPKGPDKPCQTLDNQYYVRVGSTNRAATQQELMRLFQAAGFFHFDITGVHGSAMRDLDLGEIERYFNRYAIDFSDEDESERRRLLQNTDILTLDGTVTVAGLLIFGLHPQRYLRHADISFAHFAGTEITDTLIDKQTIDGTLPRQIETAFSVIKNNLLNPSVIQGVKREETGMVYSDKVFRELLTNAGVHRNYAIAGSSIRILLFQDRIEFISPGKLPNTVTVEKMKAGVSYALNPVVVKFMENLRYIDKLGRGIPMVCHEAKKAGRNVFFEEIGEMLKVTLMLSD